MITTNSKPTIGVVGCGYWGVNLVRNFASLKVLAAVADRNAAAAAVMSQRYGVPVMGLAEMLADPAIQGVVIAAPAEQHAALVEEALLAGKHVMVEKPLALKIADAERLCRLSEECGRILMVGHLLQYHPAFIALKGLCEEGRIGKLQYVYSNRLNLGKIRTEENILWSFAPHDISMILSLLGNDLVSVSAVGHNYLHKAIADVTTTHLSFSGGQAAHIHVSWLHPFKEQRLVVIGDGGMLVFDDQQPWSHKLQLYPHRVDWVEGAPKAERGDAIAIAIEQSEPLLTECGHFVECISGSHPPRTDGAEGLQVLRVLDAAQKSMESGRPTSMVPTPAPAYFVHETAEVDQPSTVGAGSKIWHFSHVLKGSRIGRNCNIGQNVVIGPDAVVGDRCKIQNNVSVYTGVTLEDGVFCGPSMVFTNVINPRAEIERKAECKATLVKRGATIGANATIICGNTVGRYAMVGAGAVVSRDVPDHGLVVGNPARPIGWVCSCGIRLPDGGWAEASCPACGKRYTQVDGQVQGEGE